MRELGDQLGRLWLEAEAEAHEEDRPEACACGGRWQSQGWESRQVMTRLGELHYHRRVNRCSGCGQCQRLLDRTARGPQTHAAGGPCGAGHG